MNDQESNVANYRQLSLCEYLEMIKEEQESTRKPAQILTITSKIIQKKYSTNDCLDKAIQYSKSLNW